MSSEEHGHHQARIAAETVEVVAVEAEIKGPDGTQEILEVVLVEFEDLEEHGRRGTQPRKAKSYRIVVDKRPFTVHEHGLTGAQILKLVDKAPDKFTLTQKLHGGKREKIGADQYVDFSARGVERFETSPRSATNGDSGGRPPLSADDVEYLNSLGNAWEMVADGGGSALVIKEYRLPDAFVPAVVDLMIRVPNLYPAGQLDMFNVCPPVSRADQRPIPALSTFPFLGRQWQQWSRHRSSWNPAVDSVATHMALVENALSHDAA